MAITLVLMFNHYTYSNTQTKVTTNDGKEAYCSSDKFFGYNAVMMLLLMTKIIGKPERNRLNSLSRIIFGFFCLNVLIFVHIGRGIYIVYGDHKDNGAQVLSNANKTT